MTDLYRVGRNYGIHVYQGDRPVATFMDSAEATAFVVAMNDATQPAQLPVAPAPVASPADVDPSSFSRLLTTEEAAHLLAIPAGTLRWWRSQKTGPKAFRLGARKVMYREQDVEAWLEAQYAHDEAKGHR